MKNALMVFILLAVLWGVTSLAFAEEVIQPKAVIVFDLTKLSETLPAKIYFSQKTGFVQEFLDEIRKPIAEVSWTELEKCYKKFREVEAAGCDRWISRKNQKLIVTVLHNKSISIKKINILEESRESKITEDIKTLFQNISLAKTAEASKQVSFKEYILKKTRGKMKINITISGDYSGELNSTTGVTVSRELPRNPKEAGKDIEEKGAGEGLFIELITGSSEHLSLSADVPIGVLEDAKFVGTKDEGLTVKPADTPKSIYLGVNIQFIDVIRKVNFKPPFLKLMMQFSKTPFDSIGVGLGWNIPKLLFLEKIGFQTDLISVFGGIFWAKESGSNNPENELRSQLRWGLSYDLTKLTGLLKK